MAQYCIPKHNIRKFNIPNTYDINRIQLGIPVTGDEATKVGLKKVGDIILPSGNFGKKCTRNAYGYSITDKTKPMERRYVSTNWIYPFGNTNASKTAVDMYRKCLPKVEFEAYGIELRLYEDASKQQFVIVDMTEEIRNKYVTEAVNIMLEIYGKCYVYDGIIQIEDTIQRRRCNWELLPPGEMPSKHMARQLGNMGKKSDTYDIARLEYIETYDASICIEGINGFKGYYAYLLKKCCVLECAVYGNATYIIPKDNWEEMSQKTKKMLIDEKILIAKIDHTKNWKENIACILKKLEN